MGNNFAKLTNTEDVVNVRYWLYNFTKKKYVHPDNLPYIETFNNVIESKFYQNNVPYIKLMFVKIGTEQYISKKGKGKITDKYVLASLREVVNKSIKPNAIKLTQKQIDYICDKKLFLGKYICYNTTNSTQISFISPKDNRQVIIRPTFLYVINTKYITVRPAIRVHVDDPLKERNVALEKYDTYNNVQSPKTSTTTKYRDTFRTGSTNMRNATNVTSNTSDNGRHVLSHPVELNSNSEHNSYINTQQNYMGENMIHEPEHKSSTDGQRNYRYGNMIYNPEHWYYPKNKNASEYHNIISYKNDNYYTKKNTMNTPEQNNYNPIARYTSNKQSVYITPNSITRQNNLTTPRRHRIYKPDVEYTEDFDERNIKWYNNPMYAG